VDRIQQFFTPCRDHSTISYTFEFPEVFRQDGTPCPASACAWRFSAYTRPLQGRSDGYYIWQYLQDIITLPSLLVWLNGFSRRKEIAKNRNARLPATKVFTLPRNCPQFNAPFAAEYQDRPRQTSFEEP